jgi:RNA polymerase sigma-70 factor (ECF subfamily)
VELSASSNSDAALVERCVSGDRQAFADLMNRHKSTVLRLAFHLTGNRDDAEDLTQECFLRLYQALPQFDAALPFKPWFYKIATNVCLRHLSQRKRMPTFVPLRTQRDESEEVGEEEVPDESLSVEGEVLSREMRQVVLSAVNDLPTKYRIVVVLRYLEDLPYAEIAKILGIEVNAVEVRMHRAKEMLRKKLKPFYEGR